MSTPPLATEPAAPSRSEGSAGRPGAPIVTTASVAAVCGLALLASQVAVATDQLDGPLGALLARADVATVVLLVVGTAFVAGPAVDRLVGGRAPQPWAGVLRDHLLPLYALWLPVVVLDAVVVDPPASWRAWIASAVLFRDPRGVPLPGLGIGPVLTVLAMVVVLVPLGERIALRAVRRRPTTGDVLRAAAALAVVGLAVRTVLVLGGWTAPFGALSWLPAHLDAVGAGIAVATVCLAGPLPSAQRLAAGAVAAVAFLVAAIALPRAVLFTSGGDVWLRGLLYVVVATGIVAAASGGPQASMPRCEPSERTMQLWCARALAVAAPGLVLTSELAFTTIARQHVEAVVEGSLGLRTTAPGLPAWLWSAIIAAAIGVVLTAAILVPWRRLNTGRWPRQPYPIALATVVAGALLVRVVTWLNVAPPKTDGGDPFYYHVTANMLAAGRGFPEPFRWLDTGRHIAAAVHGPLYPIVLSVSSRLGGTTYVDHKFVSILIGTATVLLTALVADRLAGHRAAIVAGALAAVYPNLWLIDSLLFPEGLFALLTTACILVAYRWRDHPALWSAALLGALIGLAGLTHGEGLLLGVLLALPWMLRLRSIPLATRWRHLVVAGASCVLVLAPWTIRNMASFEEFVPLSTNSNELIMYANCEDSYSGTFIGFWSYACQQRYRDEFGEPPGDESQKAAFWRDLGVQYAQDHIGEVPKVVAVRVLRQWELFRPAQTIQFAGIENRDQESTRIGLFMYYGLVAAAIAGGVLLRRRGVPILPLVVQVVSVTITAAYAYGNTRFRAPVEPVLCMLAGVWLASLLGRRSRPVTSPAPDPVAASR